MARAGTLASIRSIPRLRENYVWWKLGSISLLGLLFCAVAIVRTIPRGPLVVGSRCFAEFFSSPRLATRTRRR